MRNFCQIYRMQNKRSRKSLSVNVISLGILKNKTEKQQYFKEPNKINNYLEEWKLFPQSPRLSKKGANRKDSMETYLILWRQETLQHSLQS